MATGSSTNEEATGEYGSHLLSIDNQWWSDCDAERRPRPPTRMPVADAKGRINYERTFPADMVPDGLLEHLSSMHVVQHGIDANDNGKYDLDALGESTFAKNLGKPGVPEEVTNPAICGVVQGAGAAHAASGGVDTGGAPAPDLNAPLAATGAALLLLSAGLLIARRPFRATTTVADDRRAPSDSLTTFRGHVGVEWCSARPQSKFAA